MTLLSPSGFCRSVQLWLLRISGLMCPRLDVDFLGRCSTNSPTSRSFDRKQSLLVQFFEEVVGSVPINFEEFPAFAIVDHPVFTHVLQYSRLIRL